MSEPLILEALANLPEGIIQGEEFDYLAVPGVGNVAIGSSTKPTNMAPRRKQRRQRRRRRTRQFNGYFRPVRIPIHECITWKETSGTDAKWYYNITLNNIVKNFDSAFDEFKVASLKVHYRPANSATTAGLYAGVLMDQKGFGAYGSASSEAWFQSLASMPGSKVQPMSTGMTFIWRPTEPDSRQWRSMARKQGDYVICTVYFADNANVSVEMGGVIILTGTLLARGKYYDAKVARIRSEHGLDWEVMSRSSTP